MALCTVYMASKTNLTYESFKAAEDIVQFLLFNCYRRYQDIVDQAVYSVLEMRGESVPSSGLTAADIFYRQVKLSTIKK